MKRVITNSKEINVDELIDRIERGDRLMVVYKVRSEINYYAFFSKTSHFHYGFRNHLGMNNKMTFKHSTMKLSLEAAIKGGKELLVFEPDEMNQIFND